MSMARTQRSTLSRRRRRSVWARRPRCSWRAARWATWFPCCPHAQRGDEIILGNKAHIFRSEAGGASALGGVSFHTIPNDERGMLDTDDIQAAVRPNDPHMPRTALVCLENTQNMCGGATLTQDDMKGLVRRRSSRPT